MLLAALLALLVGLAFLQPRLLFATASRRGDRREPTPDRADDLVLLGRRSLVANVGNPATASPSADHILEANSLWNRNNRPDDTASSAREALISAEAIQRSAALEMNASQTAVASPAVIDATPTEEEPAETETAEIQAGSVGHEDVERVVSVESGIALNGTEAPSLGRGASRTQLVEMARQWVSVVEGLVQQLETEEAQRSQMVQRISALEEAVGQNASLKQTLIETSRAGVTASDVAVVQSVADKLAGDPDHISALAVVAQNAQALHTVVTNYARMYHALEGNSQER
ncbi:MAG: hypothetical protein NVSMB52_12290 [Chloroflexota bacterium]